MTKRCDICGLAINVYEGHYMNVYEDPWQMKAYHSACYREHLIDEFRQASTPLQKGAGEMTSQDVTLEKKADLFSYEVKP